MSKTIILLTFPRLREFQMQTNYMSIALQVAGELVISLISVHHRWRTFVNSKKTALQLPHSIFGFARTHDYKIVSRSLWAKNLYENFGWLFLYCTGFEFHRFVKKTNKRLRATGCTGWLLRVRRSRRSRGAEGAVRGRRPRTSLKRLLNSRSPCWHWWFTIPILQRTYRGALYCMYR